MNKYVDWIKYSPVHLDLKNVVVIFAEMQVQTQISFMQQTFHILHCAHYSQLQ